MNYTKGERRVEFNNAKTRYDVRIYDGEACLFTMPSLKLAQKWCNERDLQYTIKEE